MPVLDVVRRRIRRSGYREEGGFTDAITDARGRTVLDARAATVFGVLIDSVATGPPAAPMGLEIAGTRQMVVTDPDGSFLFSGLPPGTHSLRVISPLFARWGIAVPETAVDAERGEVAYVRMRAPSMDDVLAHSCGAAPRPDGTANVLGRIVTASGASPSGLRVEAAWPAATGYAPAPTAAPLRRDAETVPVWEPGRDGHYATVETTTDERGLFLLCDIPHGSRLRVAVSGPADAGAPHAQPLALTTLFVPPDRGAVVQMLTVSTRPDIMYSEHYNAASPLAGANRPR